MLGVGKKCIAPLRDQEIARMSTCHDYRPDLVPWLDRRQPKAPRDSRGMYQAVAAQGLPGALVARKSSIA
jgi:hypothetical protein